MYVFAAEQLGVSTAVLRKGERTALSDGGEDDVKGEERMFFEKNSLLIKFPCCQVTRVAGVFHVSQLTCNHQRIL